MAKTIAKDITSPQEMIEAMSLALKMEGYSEDRYDFAQASEQKLASMETKADELVHTTNTGAGAELIP